MSGMVTEALDPEDIGSDLGGKRRGSRFSAGLFYALIGITASLGFSLILYWALRLDSNIGSLVANTESEPFYLWFYGLFTVGAIVLLGIDVPLLVFRWRKFGRPAWSARSGTGLGSLVSIVASACPVCGSTLLSTIGIGAGLAAFPLAGLELKAMALALMALPIWLTIRDMKTLECGDGSCPAPRDPSLKEGDRLWLGALLALVVTFSLIGWEMLSLEPVVTKLADPNANRFGTVNGLQTANQLLDEIATKVLPGSGFQSKIVLGDSVIQLVERGVIDRQKFDSLYHERGALPEGLLDVLDAPSYQPIVLTRENANVYLNLLWPLGLANYMATNKESPLVGGSLFDFASTGGWTLGREENGGVYFNQFRIVELTPHQEALATQIARNTFRPCCNNSTFFQDCNHGSALLGLLELGASQGLTEDELYREALAFNSFWFPSQYLLTALYFEAVEGIDWANIDPKVVMGREFSSMSGWSANVDRAVNQLGLLPQPGGAGCGV